MIPAIPEGIIYGVGFIVVVFVVALVLGLATALDENNNHH